MTVDLPSSLYTAAGVRELDRRAIAGGIAGITLMERAGRQVFEVMQARWPTARRIAVLCGLGNNGGDGYVVARLAHEARLEVMVLQIGDAERSQGDARLARDAMLASGVSPLTFASQKLATVDLIIDALLGTGVDRPLTGEYAEAVAAINAGGVPVLAVDIPSGLGADTGTVMGVAVRADVTVSFIGLKQGLVTAEGPEYSGDLVFSDLGAFEVAFAPVPPAAELFASDSLGEVLPRRPRNAHKGHFGHVLVIGGDYGYAGAVRMAAEAAARVGAGLVSVATRREHALVLTAVRPEIMAQGVESAADLQRLLGRASVLIVGPGLGTSSWSRELLACAFETDKQCVIDADALTLLAADPSHKQSWVLTPHPGEAARLLGESNASIQSDRYRAAQEIQRRYGGVCVLKGAGTIIAAEQTIPQVCRAGNPGMSSGGMGDVLSGVIGGLIAQHVHMPEAASLGVWLHGHAADRLAARSGERGMLATDLLPVLRELVNPQRPNACSADA